MRPRYARLFPELCSFDDGAARRRALRTAANRVYLSSCVMGAVFLVGVIYLKSAIHRHGWLGEVAVVVVAGAVCGSVGYIGLWFARRKVRFSLRQQLNEQGIRVCMGCGYDLRGQESRPCPECGDQCGVSSPERPSGKDAPVSPPDAGGI